MTIGQVAKKAEVNIQTIRFYERKGLVAPEGRRDSGYRVYGRDALKRILFIRHAQEIGFSLREIGELLSLRVDPETSCEDVKAKAELKITEVRDRVSKLEIMNQALGALIAQCHGNGPVGECPIISALDETGNLLENA
jgi:MerR family copper efflux transcriptional regulator